jgi:hypothetical protein
VTAAGQFDNHCRGCHGAAAPAVKGADVRVSSHGDGAATPLREKDGTNLRTTDAGGQSQCNACHDSHYSAKVRLFNDGKETAEATKVVNSTDCTSICHYRATSTTATSTTATARLPAPTRLARSTPPATTPR